MVCHWASFNICRNPNILNSHLVTLYDPPLRELFDMLRQDVDERRTNLIFSSKVGRGNLDHSVLNDVTCSVTRLGGFHKCLATNCIIKVAKIFC